MQYIVQIFLHKKCVHVKFLSTDILLFKEWKEQEKGLRMGLSNDWLME